MYMFKRLKEWMTSVNELEKENLEAGIINVCHPFIGAVTYIDQEQYRKYVNDKQRAISKDNRQSEE